MTKTWWREFHDELENPKDRTTGVKTSKEHHTRRRDPKDRKKKRTKDRKPGEEDERDSDR